MASVNIESFIETINRILSYFFIKSRVKALNSKS